MQVKEILKYKKKMKMCIRGLTVLVSARYQRFCQLYAVCVTKSLNLREILKLGLKYSFNFMLID